MKNVFNIITSQKVNGSVQLGTIAFSISSLKKAQKQMDTIIKMVNNGTWFVGSPKDAYEIISDDSHTDNSLGVLRDISIKNVQTGTEIYYRLCQSYLNSMYLEK